MADPKKPSEVIAEMRRELEKSANDLKSLLGRAWEKAEPKAKEAWQKAKPTVEKAAGEADAFLRKIGTSADAVAQDLQKEFKSVKDRVEAAIKGLRGGSGGPGTGS